MVDFLEGIFIDETILNTSIVYVGFVVKAFISFLQINLSAILLIKKLNQYPYLKYQFERQPLPSFTIIFIKRRL